MASGKGSGQGGLAEGCRYTHVYAFAHTCICHVHIVCAYTPIRTCTFVYTYTYPCICRAYLLYTLHECTVYLEC